MKKKLVITALTFSMVLALTGCGDTLKTVVEAYLEQTAGNSSSKKEKDQDEEKLKELLGTLLGKEEGKESEVETTEAPTTEVARETETAQETEEKESAAETVSSVATEAVASESNVSEDATTSSDATSSTESTGNRVVISIPDSELGGNTLSFTTTDLNGNSVTASDLFSPYDLTLVHIWGTYCGPCIAEIGEYGDLYRELPENVNLVGLVCDVYDGSDNNVSSAFSILNNADVTFQNLKVGGDLEGVLYSIDYVPSSFFVDKNGTVVGELMDGVHFQATKDRLYGYMR